MGSPQSNKLLGNLLRDVSRSFYLTLRILPSPIRPQISLAYLLARAADSIADTDVLPLAERLECLLQFRRLLAGRASAAMPPGLHSAIRAAAAGTSPLSAEAALLHRLPEALEGLRSFAEEDRSAIVNVVENLTAGMELDLRRFPGNAILQSLETFDQLEEYTYHVAGCVGPFWTQMCAAHLPPFRKWDLERMSLLGIRFGKALQWTNILRDIPRDLANGRCYLPRQDLERVGLSPQDLLDPNSHKKLRPFYRRCLDCALQHYAAAWEYTMKIPRSCARVRLACVWPIWIGLETMALLRQSENPLDPRQRIRIPRSRIYTILAVSMLAAPSNRLLELQYHRRMRRAEERRERTREP